MDDELLFIKELILNKKLQEFQDIKRIINVKTNSACGENENFVGEVLRVKIQVESDSGENRKINVIVKKAPLESQPFNEMYNEFKIFDAECNMYENVLLKMQTLTDHSMWKLWPDYYGHSDKDIFLQDLSTEGYHSYPKAKALELNEALLVFSSLGQMHGLSLTLVQKALYDPSDMAPNIFIRNVPALKQVEVDACNSLANAIEAEWDKKWSGFPERLRKFGESVGERGNCLWDETRGKFDVINHGDCWINNMLFKYDETGKPQQMRFVDYQACHYNCYSWDLMQVMYSALLPSLRESNMDLLLTTYLKHLKNSSSETGYHGSLPSIDEMKFELDRLAPCALIRSIICYPVFLNPDALPQSKTPTSNTEEEEEFGYKLSIYRSKYIRDILEQTLKYFDSKNTF